MFVGRYDDERSKRDAIQISDITMKSRCNVNVTFGVNPHGVNSWYDGSIYIFIYCGLPMEVQSIAWKLVSRIVAFFSPTNLGK